jgi:peroxiredoxin
MPISVGDKIPSVKLKTLTGDGPKDISTDELFTAKKVVLFALPGAFTPTCSASHLPGYVVKSDDLFAKGVDRIVCLSVNDAFVMGAWGREHNAEDRVLMIADGNAEFTKALGLEVDLTAGGMGIRSQRYAMVVEDGVVTLINVEAPRQFEISDAETILNSL